MLHNKPGQDKSKPGQDKVKFSEKKNVRVYTKNPYTVITDKKWNAFCLPFLGCSVLAFGFALIVVGGVNDIEDLVIIGCLFSAGSLIFFAMMYRIVCRPMCQRNIVESYNMMEKSGDPVPVSTKSNEMEFYNTAFDPKEDLTNFHTRPQPSEDQIYGDKMRSFMATPATTADVNFYGGDEPGTPPPPRLALPSDPGDKKNAVFTMDVTNEMKPKVQDMNQLELL